MIVKMLTYNIKKNYKIFLVFYVTCVLMVGLFFSFLSILEKSFLIHISRLGNPQRVINNARVPLIIVSLSLLYVIHYVVTFMLEEHKKEYALQSILGIPNRFISRLFSLQIIISMAISILIGLGVGYLLTLVISNFFLLILGEFSSMLIVPFSFQATCITIGAFTLMTVVTLFVQRRRIKCMVVLEFLKNRKKINLHTSYTRLLLVQLFLTGICTPLVLYEVYRSVGIDLPLWQIINFVIIFLLLVMTCFFREKTYPVVPFVRALLMIFYSFCLLCIYLSVSTVGAELFPYNPSNMIPMAGILLVVGILSLLYSTGNFISFMRLRNQKWYYPRIITLATYKFRIASHVKTITFIAICFTLSIMTIFASSLLPQWLRQYNEKKIFADIELSSEYKHTKEAPPESLFLLQADMIEDALKKNQYSVAHMLRVRSYFMHLDDFKQRKKNNFPPLAIGMSDYNALLAVQGVSPITLAPNSVGVQVFDGYFSEETTLPKQVEIAGNSYNVEDGYFQNIMPIHIFNSYTEYIYVVPDHALTKAYPAKSHIFWWLKSSGTYDVLKSLDTKLMVWQESLDEYKKSFLVRIQTLEDASAMEGVVVLILLLSYMSMLLIVFPAVVLSIQLLAHKSRDNKWFSVLHHLGDTKLQKHRLSWVLFWIFIPSVLAIVLSCSMGGMLLCSNWIFLSSLVGVHFLVITGAVTLLLFSVIITLFTFVTYRSYRE